MFRIYAITRIRKDIDGEGIRTLIALQGCPLRCKYCINKGTQKKIVARSECTPAELYDVIRLDRPYFMKTNGGITFGGGEPLLQIDDISEFVKLVGGHFSVFAETSLNVPAANVLKAAEVIDYFYVDIKTTNPQIYKDYTHGELETALSNLATLVKLVGPGRITVRVPVIPGYTEKKDCLESVEFLKTLGLTEFDVFKYTIKSD